MDWADWWDMFACVVQVLLDVLLLQGVVALIELLALTSFCAVKFAPRLSSSLLLQCILGALSA